METFYFGLNPNPQHLIAGNVVQFWFLVVLGVGMSIAPMMPVKDNPEKPFRPWPWRVRMVLGVCVFLIMVGIAYHVNWTTFYQMDVNGDRIALRYFYPERWVTISREMISRTNARREDVAYVVFEISTTGGQTYRGTRMSSGRFKEQYPQMQAVLSREQDAAQKGPF